MDTTLLIIVLIISLLACAVSIVLLAIVIKRSKAPASDTKTIESIGEIKATLQSLHNDIPSMVDNSVTKKMVDVQKQLGDSANSNAKSMSDFSKNMTDTLANNVAATNKTLQDSIVAINKKVDDNFKSVNDKVNASLSEGFKGTSDTMSSIKERLAKIDEAQKEPQN